MSQVFPIAKAGGAGVYLPLFIMVPLLLLFTYTIYSSRWTTFNLTPDGLRISGDIYGRFVPLTDLVTHDARAMDLKTDPDHKVSWRTNGIGLPGYQSGWFRLKNGEKALLFVTEKSSVVYVPTRSGYAIMMSVPDPERFVTALRNLESRP